MHDCGECVRRCQVFAHTFNKATDEKPVYHREKCVGCGSCTMGCTSGALHLEPVSEEEWFHVASSFIEWEEKRLEYLTAQEISAAHDPNWISESRSDYKHHPTKRQLVPNWALW